MFGFFLFAAFMPAYELSLNEWSSTPPVSSTMQALKAAPEAELLPLALPPELDGLLPHADSTRAAAATPESTAPVRFICTDFILSRSEPGPGGTGVGVRPGTHAQAVHY